MKVAVPSLAPILRSDTQGRLLALLLAEPLREYNLGVAGNAPNDIDVLVIGDVDLDAMRAAAAAAEERIGVEVQATARPRQAWLDASESLLAVQGLRSRTRGGHIAVVDAVRAQFNDKGGTAVFGQINRLRRRRNDTEYRSTTTPRVTSAEAA